VDGRIGVYKERNSWSTAVIVIVRNTLHEHATGQRFKQGEREKALSLSSVLLHKRLPLRRQHHRRGSMPHCCLPALTQASKRELLEDA
jgi:hypothetical protein